MTERAINGKELKRLQTLWGKFVEWRVASGAWPVKPTAEAAREMRLDWLSGVTSRHITSAKELSAPEAAKAIDELQKALPAELVKRGPRDRELDRARGTAGRRGTREGGAIWMPDQQTIALVEKLYRALGWTRERYDAFIRSNSSPTRGAMPATMGQYNAVISALKRMVRAQERAGTQKSEIRSQKKAGEPQMNTDEHRLAVSNA